MTTPSINRRLREMPLAKLKKMREEARSIISEGMACNRATVDGTVRLLAKIDKELSRTRRTKKEKP